jgi:hypothetical protein
LQYEKLAAGKNVPSTGVVALVTTFAVTEDASRETPWIKPVAGRADRAYSAVQISLREVAVVPAE